jgi:hypothetical protein
MCGLRPTFKTAPQEIERSSAEPNTRLRKKHSGFGDKHQSSLVEQQPYMRSGCVPSTTGKHLKTARAALWLVEKQSRCALGAHFIQAPRSRHLQTNMPAQESYLLQ